MLVAAQYDATVLHTRNAVELVGQKGRGLGYAYHNLIAAARRKKEGNCSSML